MLRALEREQPLLLRWRRCRRLLHLQRLWQALHNRLLRVCHCLDCRCNCVWHLVLHARTTLCTITLYYSSTCMACVQATTLRALTTPRTHSVCRISWEAAGSHTSCVSVAEIHTGGTRCGTVAARPQLSETVPCSIELAALASTSHSTCLPLCTSTESVFSSYAGPDSRIATRPVQAPV